MTDDIASRCLPLGFRFATGYAGLRKTQSDDLALMVSDTPASAAGVFTRNMVRAAPVDLSAGFLRKSGGIARVIVANAGNANCATDNMHAVSEATARSVAELAGIPEHHSLVASTGVIGEPFDEGLIPRALPRLWEKLDRTRFEACAEAIKTTDTVPKVRYRLEATGRDDDFRLAGIAKGAGMIMPDMATMLSFVFTDAAIEPGLLQEMLTGAVDRSFNCITVDSDTSTNDTVLLLANGASGVRIDEHSNDTFYSSLVALTRELALDIVSDGEGAGRVAEIRVRGTATDRDAKTIAMAVANSPLVKTALAGADPNWGRILGAAGKAGVRFDPTAVKVLVNDIKVCENGLRANFSESEVQTQMEGKEVRIDVQLGGDGTGQAVVWTCDLTEQYIRINADYRT